MQHKGFTIEVSRDRRGQWRFRLRKTDRGYIRMRGDETEINEWVSAAFMDEAFAIEQAKAAINSGRVS